MKSSIFVQDIPLPVDVYKDGAVGIRITDAVKKVIKEHRVPIGDLGIQLLVRAHIRDAEGQLALIYLLDYLEETYQGNIGLALPFVPNARQDRVTADEATVKPATLKSTSRLFNGYSKVVVVFTADVHSEVSTVLFDKSVNLPQADVFLRIKNRFDFENDVIISPDLGAYKKASEVAKRSGVPLGVAIKERHPITNEIVATKILDADIRGRVVTIVDDILDGGRTFLPLAKALKEQGAARVNLAVTHGIFSYGASQLKTGDIDKIYSYYCWLTPEQVKAEDGFVEAVEYF